MTDPITEGLRRIVGEEHVLLQDELLEAYSRDMNFRGAKPRWLCRPKDAEEVVRTVRWAIENRISLIPVSSGPPHFRGDTVPSLGGTCILDLTSMKRIIRVDRKNRVVMFEPGVTFGELEEAAEKEGIRLNMPLLPRQSKSVLGSLLEREPVLMPKYQWDIADPLTCIEVVVGTGEVMRTGSAAGPGDIEEQWRSGGAQKEAAGPSAASWYRVIQGAQGTMGVVTWATARCEVLPRLESPFFVGASSIERLLPMVHWLIRLRLANECFILNARNFSLIASSLGLVDGMRMKREIPSWVLFFNLAAYDYLPEERLSGLIEDTMEISKDLGLEPQKVLWKLRAEDFLQSVRRPCPEPCWKLLFGGCEDVFFLARWEKIPGHLRTMAGLVERGDTPSENWACTYNPSYKVRPTTWNSTCFSRRGRRKG